MLSNEEENQRNKDILDDTMVDFKFQMLTNKVKYRDYMMPYGKFKGHFLADLKVNEPEYFMWASEHCYGELQKAFMWHRGTKDDDTMLKR